MNRHVKTAIGFALGLVVAVVLANRLPLAPSAPSGSDPRLAAPRASATAQVPVPGGAGVTEGFGAGIGFRSREHLVEHHRKHGHEFGEVSPAEYLQLAQALRDRAASGDVLELARADGVITRFDRASGAFLAFDGDGTIRTFFRPRDGERYFRRQAQRAR